MRGYSHLLRALRNAGLAAAVCSCCVVPLRGNADSVTQDPYFGEALFHAHQGNYFGALERLDSELAQHYQVDEPNLDSLFPHLGQAEFSVGDFELRYRMHSRAGRAIRAVLEGDVPKDIKADAAFRLARIHFQKGQATESLRVLDSIEEPIPNDLNTDIQFLRANVLSALDRASEAAEVLRLIQSAKSLRGFAAYNLGIALLENQNPKAALSQLDRAGRVKAESRETRAIRDKSNLVLGTLLFEAGAFKRAGDVLNRVRLEGPFSNSALLRAGWSEISSERFERAVVPWSILAKRDGTDSAVQEAKLALPFAYSKLEIHGRAAVLYQEAVSDFGNELVKLDASIQSVSNCTILEALEGEEIREDKDWVVRLRSLPDAPETFYLVSLMASHDFQTALQNYLDLAELRRELEEGERSLKAFEEMIRIRRAYYKPRLPEVDHQFRILDAQRRVRLEQKNHLEERLNKMLTAPAPELLATASENKIRQRIDALEATFANEKNSLAVEQAKARLDRLRGFLYWKQDTEYHDRLTTAHQHLRELNEHVDHLTEKYESFVRTRQAAVHSYEGYQSSITNLKDAARKSLKRLDILQERQGEMLERVAAHELQVRRERLIAYQNKARFAFADSYDRAAKGRSK